MEATETLLPQSKPSFFKSGPFIITVTVIAVVVFITMVALFSSSSPNHLDTNPPGVSYVLDTNAVSNISSTKAYTIPCLSDGTGPSGCSTSRVRTVTCNVANPNGYPTVLLDEEFNCESYKLKLREYYNVQFFKATSGQCLEITVQVGECWGRNPKNGGSYDCQGECGASCVNGCGLLRLGGGWSRNCLRHDICSWYFAAAGGGSDPNCGKSYYQADHDIFNCNCEIAETHSCNF